MVERVLIGIVILIFFYTVVPYIFSFGLGLGVYRKNKESKKLAFTFDDGPHEIYTPMLLDLLNDNNIKATFFVLGSKAEQFPEIIQRMHAEGHLIGMHNYVHRSNWMMTPRKVLWELNRSAAIVEGITGVRPVYYRPPWGLLNILDYFILKKFNVVLWSLMVNDWRSVGGSERVKKELLKKINQGDIILLHDSGETIGADEDAPYNTIEALKDVFKEVRQRGFSSVRIDEM
ncbi:MAG: polysaccharide deacetylase family protein [Bacillota bacterium]|nr:polysaccharide deacetylase family protein [Bacillota bacterium]MDP4169296.1 polysaccharide deacetylase family protein [Bacillota bacterium]